MCEYLEDFFKDLKETSHNVEYFRKVLKEHNFYLKLPKIPYSLAKISIFLIKFVDFGTPKVVV